MKKELDKMKIGGVILSGGKSRRMKSDKSLKKINNIPLIEIVLSKSMEQLDYVLTSFVDLASSNNEISEVLHNLRKATTNRETEEYWIALTELLRIEIYLESYHYCY